MINQLVTEGIVLKRKNGIVDIVTEKEEKVGKITIKRFSEESGNWEVYGIVIKNDLLTNVQSMDIGEGEKVIVSGSAYQHSYTNPITGEAQLFFIINANSISRISETSQQQAVNEKATPKSDPKSETEKNPTVRDATEDEVPFPTAK